VADGLNPRRSQRIRATEESPEGRASGSWSFLVGRPVKKQGHGVNDTRATAGDEPVRLCARENP